jgi:hypothetical protein
MIKQYQGTKKWYKNSVTNNYLLTWHFLPNNISRFLVKFLDEMNTFKT